MVTSSCACCPDRRSVFFFPTSFRASVAVPLSGGGRRGLSIHKTCLHPRSRSNEPNFGQNEPNFGQNEPNQVTARKAALVRRSPPSGEGGCGLRTLLPNGRLV